MHPALSIIVFTVLSGLGYGLAAALGLGLLDPAAPATKVAHLLALALIAGGLMSSTLHLGNPQRAWRAFSQWRSSWLSREGVMAVLTFVPLLVSAWATIVESRYIALSGLLGTVLSLATVYCTSMIYASLKSVQAWHTPLTPLCYLLFAAAGGFGLAAFFAAAGGGPVRLPAALAVVFLIVAWAAKLFWRNRMNTAASDIHARNRDRARIHRQGAAVRTPPCQRQLPDQRNGVCWSRESMRQSWLRFPSHSAAPCRRCCFSSCWRQARSPVYLQPWSHPSPWPLMSSECLSNAGCFLPKPATRS